MPRCIQSACLVLAAVCTACCTAACGTAARPAVVYRGWDHFLADLGTRSGADRAATAAAFVEQFRGRFPLVDGGRAVFAWHGPAGAAAVAGDHTDWKPVGKMTRLEGTDLWWAAAEFPADARFEYKLVVDGTWRLDPLNPRRARGGYGENSECRLTDYAEPAWRLVKIRPEPGRVTRTTIKSAVLGSTHGLAVWTPPGYDTSRRYPLLLLHDGLEYLSLAETAQLLDLLVFQKRIVPLVVAFVAPHQRTREYACSETYLRFTADELLPRLASGWSLSTAPRERIAGGASMGGIVSFFLAARLPGQFGGALCQSGAFLFGIPGPERASLQAVADWLAPLALERLRGQRFWLDCGNIGPLEQFLLAGNRTLRDRLAAAGVAHRFTEVNEAHNWGSWRKRLEDGLVYFFGKP